jgi:hypothetical protein
LTTPELMDGHRLDPEYLSIPMLRAVLRACYAVERARGTWDFLSVQTALENVKPPGMGDPREFLIVLGESFEPMMQVPPVVERLQALALARKQLDCLRSAEVALEAGRLADGAELVRRVSEVSYGPTDTEVLSAAGVMEYGYKTLADLTEGRSKQVAFGIAFLDRYVGGITPGSMSVIGGTTGSGKSSLILLAALRMAAAGHRPGIVSCEDPKDVWAARIAAHLENVPSSRIYRDCPEKQAGLCSRFARAVERAEKLPIEFAMCIGGNTGDVVDATRRLIVDRGCDAVFVDHIQAIRIDLKVSRYDKAVADISKQLKGHCARLGVPLVLGSQLSRLKDSPYKEPQLFHLKESGDLENEAELVILLWQESDRQDAATLCKVAKLKWGPSGFRGMLKRSWKSGMIVDIVEKTDDLERGEPRPKSY